ncbi:MAG: PTS sugar transporter subunit IIB [Anaerolineae bacterium]|jgi:PTS system galactitol-specific IIB component|nr:PTS sugar transporter subunit IIB [Anaerolineae bacterium]MDH7474443.1 PTS sugar transporter subunit IIB [Anaerolineae bacterium]
MNGEKRVLIACGTSIATATVVAEKVKEIAKEAGISVRVAQCKAAEVRGRITTFNPHVIVATTPVPKDLGIPVFNGVPFLSGVGMDVLKAQILEALRKA